MNATLKILCMAAMLAMSYSCRNKETQQTNHLTKQKEVTAKDILGNPNYQAICYEGYRDSSRSIQPTVEQLQEDLKIMAALGIRIVRTYNVQLPHASNLLKAISELKNADTKFEMYVMLGAWIDCKNAWLEQAPDHYAESEQNEGEVARAVALVNQYPDIVKVLAIGNEAMVKWATSYHVQPSVILKWVNHTQSLKDSGKLPKDLWITSSDDFSSWGGADASYHTEDLTKLAKAVDYISIHTYPFHNTHYNPNFWHVTVEESKLSDAEKLEAAMLRARDFAKAQYDSVASYMKSVGVTKPIHIGETGWATVSDGFYGSDGTRAADQYKQALYYKHIREWTDAAGISCFYFEAFDEQWKDAGNPKGSENHFGLFTIDGKAKYALWDVVDQGIVNGLMRGGNELKKTYGGDKKSLMKEVALPPNK
jgi:exo-beta-1,3-glucanase (GH17 family)